MSTCSARGFKALMATQFLGAFNDNFFKTALTLLIMNKLVSQGGGTFYLSLAAGMFVLPYILFASWAGALADRFSKSTITISTKVLEVAVMVFGCTFLFSQNILALLIVLFFMGTQSALFSPAKYGMLPEILNQEQLSRGNGYLELWTFVAILSGTAIGGYLPTLTPGYYGSVGVGVLLVAVFGLVTSFWVTRTTAGDPSAKLELNPFGEVLRTIKVAFQDRPIYLTIVASAYFWFVGSYFQLSIFLYAKQMVGTSDAGTAALVTTLAIGIGLGSVLAGKLSEGKVELGLVPLGALGMSLFSLLLSVSYESFTLSALCLLLLGISAGGYIVPLNAFLQHKSPEDKRGKYLAASNFVTFVGVILSAALLWFLKDVVRLSAADLFLWIGVVSVAATIYIIITLPEMLVRCINWLLTHSIYKVTVSGLDNLPTKGGALLVCNHVTYVDPPLVLAVSRRPVRFLMYRPLYENRWLGWAARIMGAIPVSSHDPQEKIAESLQMAQEAINRGELVCIFAEGGLTRTGELMPFKRGLERIASGTNAPIIPCHLDDLWGSIFSYSGGKFFWKWPKRLPYPVTVTFGQAMPPSSTSAEVRDAVLNLGTPK